VFLLFLKGLLIGFSIAAPVGPIGVLCIRRTLAEGRATGFVSGLGAATADAFYGVVAGFGLTLVSVFLQGQGFWFRLIGGAFLGYLGVRTFLAKPADSSRMQSAPAATTRLVDHPTIQLLAAYLSTLFLTITNPATILSFIAVFGVLRVGMGTDYVSAGMVVAGVFSGSALWWLMLSISVGVLRAKFDANAMKWVNRISGLILTGFGVGALISLIA
jgi:threonine/homoserine/homoserine lactone efflux protein